MNHRLIIQPMSEATDFHNPLKIRVIRVICLYVLMKCSAMSAALPLWFTIFLFSVNCCYFRRITTVERFPPKRGHQPRSQKI